MSELPTAKEVGFAILTIITSVGAAFKLWSAQSKTKLSVAQDSSKGDWLKDMEDRLQKALDDRDRALERERLALDRVQDGLGKIAALEARIALFTEGMQRRDRRIRRLSLIVLKHAPDLAEALDSLPGVLDGPREAVPPTPSTEGPDES